MHGKQEHKNSENLQIWFCQHCDNIHFKISNITLDFSKKEFLALSNAMLGILRDDFTEQDLRSVLNLQEDNDDVLLSKTLN